MKKDHVLLERAAYAWSEDSIRLIVTPSSTAKSTYFYIQEAGYFKTTCPYFTERKSLDSFLIVYTISGTGYLDYEDRRFELTKGSSFFISCEQHHHYWTGPEDDWEFLWIHFNGNSALGYYREFTRNGFDICNCRDGFFMERTIWRILALHQKKDLTTELVTANLIGDILTELLVQTVTNNQDTFLIPDYIKAMAKDMDKNFKSALSLAYFEEHYLRSRYHLTKEFKKYMGITVNEYLILTRLAHAKELLKYSELPVGEIAFEVGFSNVTHFINLFKAREETTPLAYRKAWKN